MKEPPVAVLVCIRQIGARDVPPETKVIEKARFGIQAGDDVTQALAIGQLSKAQSQEVIVFCNPAGWFA